MTYHNHLPSKAYRLRTELCSSQAFVTFNQYSLMIWEVSISNQYLGQPYINTRAAHLH